MDIFLVPIILLPIMFFLGKKGVGAKKSETFTVPRSNYEEIKQRITQFAYQKQWSLHSEEKTPTGGKMKFQAGQYGLTFKGAQYVTISITSQANQTLVEILSQSAMSQLVDYGSNKENINAIKSLLMSSIPSQPQTQIAQSAIPPKKSLFSPWFFVILGALFLLFIGTKIYLAYYAYQRSKEYRIYEQEMMEKLEIQQKKHDEMMDKIRNRLSSTPPPASPSSNLWRN